jgi:diacylglycerol kinase family enzyme
MNNHSVEIVVTPGSGDGRALGLARRLRRLLRRRRRRVTIRAFDDLAGLVRWAESGACESSHVVCVGGDATLSAAARAAIRCNAPLLPVPTGFGNIFATVFRHPRRARHVAWLLERGEPRRVDVGVVTCPSGEEDLFLSHRSYGLLEQVQTLAERGRRQPRRRLVRYLWYWGVAYRFLFRAQLAGFSVEVDGRAVATDAVLVTVANVETYHGFLSLTPTASPIDGLFDVAIIPRVSTARLLWRLLRLLLQVPGRWNGLALHRGRHVVVTTPRRREVLAVRRQALPLVVPPGAVEALTARTVPDAPTPAQAGAISRVS